MGADAVHLPAGLGRAGCATVRKWWGTVAVHVALQPVEAARGGWGATARPLLPADAALRRSPHQRSVFEAPSPPRKHCCRDPPGRPG